MRKVTQEELGKLSLPAVVAFAARCAERVWPIFERSNMFDSDKGAVREALDVAKSAAQIDRAPSASYKNVKVVSTTVWGQPQS